MSVAESEFERKMQKIAAEIAPHLLPRRRDETPLKEFKFAAEETSPGGMSGMAEVLAAHPDWLFSIERQEVVCAGKSCDWAQGVGPHQPSSGVFRTHQAAALNAAGFGPVKDEKRLMQLAALMAYDAVEDNVKREAAAKALEDAADAIRMERPEIGPHINVSEYRMGKHDAFTLAAVICSDRARAAAVRGES